MLNLLVILVTLAFQTPAQQKTVWTGVYTTAQAARGQAQYTANCARCHGETLLGTNNNALQGKDFMDYWREDNADSLFNFIRSSMPPAPRGRGANATPRVPLADNAYIDIISYIMQANTFPPGNDELTAESLHSVRIEGKLGPMPLPTSALVLTIGCMTKEGTNWVLADSIEPMRTRSSEVTTTDELKTATAKPSANLKYRLSDFGYIGPSFVPEDHAGQRMLTKGTLVKQPGAERINVTSMVMIAPTCK